MGNKTVGGVGKMKGSGVRSEAFWKTKLLSSCATGDRSDRARGQPTRAPRWTREATGTDK